MNNPTQHWRRIFVIRRRVAGAALALAIMLVSAVLATGSAQAQTYSESVLHTFTGPPDGASPTGSALDAKGNLYGIAGGGDSACDPPYGCGTVFKVDASGTETVLYSFTGTGGGRRRSFHRFNAGRAGQPVWHYLVWRRPCMQRAGGLRNGVQVRYDDRQ